MSSPEDTNADEPDAPRSTGRRARAWRFVATHPWPSAVVAIVIIAGIVLAVVLPGGSDDTQTAAVRTTTSLQTVSRTTLKQTVSADGTFAPADEKDVSFGSAATITSVRVTEGQRVTKGQVLGTIATVALKQALAEARATLAQAESTLSDAQDSSATTDSQLAADEAAVTSAKDAVAAAKTELADAVLRAPIAGTVAAVNVTTGDQATGSGGSSTSATGSTGSGNTAGSGGTSGQPATSDSSASTSSSSSGDFVVVGGASWQVSATVDDTEVGLIAKGDQAQLTTDNVSGTVFGTVSAVSVLSSGSSSSASYPVTIAVTGSPDGLHDGASATVSIIYKQLANALTVPATAVQNDNGTRFVYVSKNGAKTKQAVTVGVTSGGVTQIKSGLGDGDKVYVTTIARTGGRGAGAGTQSGNTGNFPGGGNLPGGGNFPGGGNLPGGGNFPGSGSGSGNGGSR